tara:strand:+ start:9061 stop:10287 length:1227 start_codon:yes stop_codon:yes gene_type:complete
MEFLFWGWTFPAWLVVLLTIGVGLAGFFLIRSVKLSIDTTQFWKRQSQDWQDRCNVMQAQDQEVISRVVAEEITKHGDQSVNMLQSAMASHYSEFREEIVNGFMDRGNQIMTGLADDMTERLVQATQPIVNDTEENGSFILPTGTRHAFQKGKTTVLLIEAMPGLRTVMFTDRALKSREKSCGTRVMLEDGGRCYRMSLSFPYTYFLFTFYNHIERPPSFARFAIYFRGTPLTSIRQSLYPAPLFNVGSDSNGAGSDYICMGSMPLETQYMSIAQTCDSVITQWWSRSFHSDLNEADFRKSPLGKIDQWKKKSDDNALWACNVKWKNGVKTKKLIEEAMRQGGTAMPSVDCRREVEQVVYKMAKDMNHAVVQMRPDANFSLDSFQPPARKSLQANLVLLTNKIVERIT